MMAVRSIPFGLPQIRRIFSLTPPLRKVAAIQSTAKVLVAAEGDPHFPQTCNGGGRRIEDDVAASLSSAIRENIRMRLSYSLPCFGLIAAALSGCTDSSTPVSISYRQIGFCDTYTTPGGSRAARPNEVYVVYKIDAIDNAKRGADFNFLPTRLYVDPGEWGAKQTPWKSKPGDAQDWFYRRDHRRFISNDTSFAQAAGVRPLAASVVSRAEKKEIGNYSIVEVPALGGDHPIEQISFKLSYDPQEGDGDSIPADPPIVLNNVDAAQTSWPHSTSCAELSLEKLAS
jgi:hypothetical protein